MLSVYMTSRGKKHEFTNEELDVKYANPKIPSFNDSSYFAGISKEGFSFVTWQSFSVDKPNENWMMA